LKTITLTAELAQDLRSGEAPPECGYKVVADYESGESRWATIRTLVIKDTDGRFFAGDYRSGTGDNGERPWEYDDTAEFTEVVARQKVVTEYVSADKVPAPEPGFGGLDPRALAIRIVESETEDIDFVGIAEAIEGWHSDEVAAMPEEDFDKLHRRVDELASKAVVTVEIPDEVAG